MIRGTADHPKTKNLRRFLKLEPWGAVGVLESIWHFTGKFARQGDIGKFSNAEIAEGIGWSGDPDQLIEGLLTCGGDGRPGFLERDSEYRLIVHDWDQYADKSVRTTLQNLSLDFVKNIIKCRAIDSETSKPGTGKRKPNPGSKKPNPGKSVSGDQPEPEPGTSASNQRKGHWDTPPIGGESSETPSLLGLLVDGFHINPKTANEIIAEFDPSDIRDQIEWLPYRAKNQKDAGGLLVSAIRGQWSEPTKGSDRE